MTEAVEVDHVIPLHKDGPDCFDTNGQGLCIPCHKDKTAKDRGGRGRTGLDGWPV